MTATLTADQLFTPAQSGVGLDPTAPIPAGTWLSMLIDTAQILELDTTAWQPGGPELTILAVSAVALAREDVFISLNAQGGFLDFAASGTVTATGIDGTTVIIPVTPDPSIPSQNPTGAPGWLDALGQSSYDVFRLAATQATGPLAIVNVGITTPSYAIGGYHVANTTTSATYSNTAALSIPPSILPATSGAITAIVTGASPTVTTNTAHGLAIGDVVYITGVVGVTGINGVFASVTGVPSATSIIIGLTCSGTWTSGGQIYKCTVANMAADTKGIGSNASAGQVTSPITQTIGVSTYNLTAWSAANWENNTQYAARCRLKLGALSPNGPSQAYEYFALTAASLLAAATPSYTFTNGPIIKAIAFSNPQTEVVTTVVSSSTPASTTLGQQVTPGCAQLAITAATNATPIAITTASAHGLTTGDAAILSGVLGNTGANGTFTITRTGANTFTLNGSAGTGAYTGGGRVDGGDLGEVDALLQANVVPDAITALTVSSLAFPITIVATVVVPQAYVATYQAAVQTSLTNLLASYPIGGNIPPGGSAGTVPYSAVEGALVDAGVLTVGGVSYVRQVSGLIVNGGAVDVNYPSPYHDAQLAPATIAVIGV